MDSSAQKMRRAQLVSSFKCLQLADFVDLVVDLRVPDVRS